MSRHSFFLLSWLVMSGMCVPALEKSPAVEERGGKIYLLNNDGTSKLVTDSAKDHSPALSPDGREIVFVRDLLGDPDYNDFLRVGPASQVTQLWIADVSGRRPPTLALDSPVVVNGRQFSKFYSPQFGERDEFIYFQIQYSATSGAIVRLKVGSKEPVYITNALDFAVVPTGPYRGDLLVLQHRPRLGPGHYDWFYVFTPDGHELGVIGGDKGDVSAFLNSYVGDVSSCRSWNEVRWMSCISQIR